MADSGLGPTSFFDGVGKMGDMEFSQFERDLKEDFLLDTFGGSSSNFENTSSDRVVESLPVPDDAMTDWAPRISMTTDANLSCDVQIVKPVSPFNQSICAELYSSQKKTCIVLAADMLRSILVRPTSCLCSVSSGNTPPSNPDAQMSGHVLTRNRDIERSLSRMLDCACSQSSQLQLIIIAVFYRLISWYRAFNSGNIVSGSHPSTKTQHEGYFADERVVQEPVTIGGYRLEATLAERIRRQILLDELLKLQNLLERLSTRSGESDTFERGEGPSMFDSGHISKKGAGFQEEIFGRLTECLSRQMRALKTDLGAVG